MVQHIDRKKTIHCLNIVENAQASQRWRTAVGGSKPRILISKHRSAFSHFERIAVCLALLSSIVVRGVQEDQ